MTVVRPKRLPRETNVSISPSGSVNPSGRSTHHRAIHAMALLPQELRAAAEARSRPLPAGGVLRATAIAMGPQSCTSTVVAAIGALPAVS